MLALSDDLTRKGVSLRAARDGDTPFLRALFAAARLDAPLLAHWPAEQREPFLDSQFRFQDLHYRQVHAQADYLVVEMKGAAVGRLILDRGGAAWCVVDIALVPQMRGQGLGGDLLRWIQHGAAQARLPIELHVEIANRARALYDRLGFMETDDIGTHIAMRWTPPVS